jgi:hypothetical protein
MEIRPYPRAGRIRQLPASRRSRGKLVVIANLPATTAFDWRAIELSEGAIE